MIGPPRTIHNQGNQGGSVPPVLRGFPFGFNDKISSSRDWCSEKVIVLENEILIFSIDGKSLRLLDPQTLKLSECLNPNNSRLIGKEKGWSVCADEENNIILYGRTLERGLAHLQQLLDYDTAMNFNSGSRGGERPQKSESVIELLSFTDSQELSCTQLGTYDSPSFCLTNHTANVHGRLMYIFGGQNTKNELQNTLNVFHIDRKKWVSSFQNEQSLPDELTPKARCHHSSIIVSGKLYIYGGKDSQNNTLNDIWSLDLTTQYYEWKNVTPDQGLSPIARIGVSLNSFGGKILLCGGENCKSISSYDIEDQQWDNYKTAEKITWSHVSTTAVVYKDKLIIGNGDCFSAFSLHREKSAKSTFGSDMKAFFKRKRDADVSFIVEGKEISANKAILKNRCPYFKKMFESGMKEAQGKPIDVPNGVKYDIFSKLLEYLYCDNVVLDEESAADLLKLSDEYEVKSLKALCEEFLVGELRKTNVIKFAELADKYTAPELKDAVLKCINTHRNSFDQSDMFSLPKSILVELLSQKS